MYLMPLNCILNNGQGGKFYCYAYFTILKKNFFLIKKKVKKHYKF